MLQGKRFGYNEEPIAETEACFEAKDNSLYKKRHRDVREALECMQSLLMETVSMNKVEFRLNVVVSLSHPTNLLCLGRVSDVHNSSRG